MKPWPAKDPDELLDYEVDWATNRLEDSETIDVSTWTLEETTVGEVGDSTIVIHSDPPYAPAIVDGVTKVWISGGEVGEIALVNNHIETSTGRVRDLSCKLKIKQKKV